MTTRSHGPHAGSHAAHDRLLVAARAAGDLAGADWARSEALLATCPSCRALHDELVAVAAATRALPAPTRPASLDFRISPDRAATLARGGLWRRLLRPFGRSGSTTVRPIAAALTTLGLAGLLLAALPALPLGGAAGGLTFMAASAESGAPREEPAATGDPEAVPPDAAASPETIGRDTSGDGEAIDSNSGSGPLVPTGDDKGSGPAEPTAATDAESQSGSDEDGAGDGQAAAAAPGAGGPGPLVLLSLGLLAAGVGLFVLRGVALRVR